MYLKHILIISVMLILMSTFIISFFFKDEHPKSILQGSKFWLLASVQWMLILPIMFVGTVMTYVLSPFIILTSKNLNQPHGKPSPQKHSDKYLMRGSSGTWYYRMSTNRFLKQFGNYEDGLYGEPSGKWSASINGKEKSFIGQLLWLYRNPFNYAKRNSKVLACFVNDCTVAHLGSGDLNDKTLDKVGSYRVVGRPHRRKGLMWANYYGYRKVMYWDDSTTYKYITGFLVKYLGFKEDFFKNRVYNLTLGFKIKPSHAWSIQDNDDLDKAFTFRVQLTKKGQWVTKI